MSHDDPRMLVRAAWSWPLATLLVGGTQAVVNATRFGGDVVSWLLVPLGAASLGLWLGALGLLVGTLLRRWEARLAPGRARVRGFVGGAAGQVLVALGLTVVGWHVVEEAAAFAARNPPDFDDVAIQVWRAAVVGGIPVVALLAFAVGRRLDRLVEARSWAPGLTRVLTMAWCLWFLAHMCSGGFNLYVGRPLTALLVVVAAVCGALWLPRSVARTRRNVVIALGLAATTAIVGSLALRHVGARALIMHDSRVMPRLEEAAIAFLDGDGDGDLALGLGGQDCDDADPRVASWRPEVPGNGKDDNCRLGDAPPREPPPKPTPATGPRPPIYLITLDTVRADHLAGLGHDRDTMPALAAQAAKGRWFLRAYSPSNYTMFSVLSLLSGQSPEYLVHDPEVLRVQQAKFTHWLPHRLSRHHGYETVAYRPPLVDLGKIPLEEYRFQKFYGTAAMDYYGFNRGSTAKQTVEWVLDVLANEKYEAPRFSWVHIFDPHAVHMAHEEFPVEGDRDAYDNELRWVDRQLSRLFEALERRHGDDLVVIITSDHGEEFGRRGEYGHGFTLHEEEIHVPLLVRGPGIEPGEVSEPVNVAGIVPMVLELLGDPPGSAVSYPSVLEPSDAVVVNSPFFWKEEKLQVALVEQRYKIIHARATDTMLVFDLQEDPREERNLAARDPELRERLEARLYGELEALR